MSDIQFEPSALRRAGEGMEEAVSDLVAKTEALMGEVGDVSALGTNDTLGGIASMLYSAVLERVQETVSSVSEEYSSHGQRLLVAAQVYEATEEAAVQASGTIMGGA